MASGDTSPLNKTEAVRELTGLPVRIIWIIGGIQYLVKSVADAARRHTQRFVH
jgi:hypothetical protein